MIEAKELEGIIWGSLSAKGEENSEARARVIAARNMVKKGREALEE